MTNELYRGVVWGKPSRQIELHSVDMTPFLVEGDTVSAATITAATGLDATMIDASDETITFQLGEATTKGETYQVDIVGQTANGEQFDFIFYVDTPDP